MSPSLRTSPDLRRLFLETLEETCSVKHAAEACGIARSVAYYHRSADLEFAREWDAAVERALDDLLGEAHRRATVEKSDRLLEVLLKFRYGDQLAERLSLKVEQSTGLTSDVLLQMAPDDRVALQGLLAKYVRTERAGALLEHDPGAGER